MQTYCANTQKKTKIMNKNININNIFLIAEFFYYCDVKFVSQFNSYHMLKHFLNTKLTEVPNFFYNKKDLKNPMLLFNTRCEKVNIIK